MTFSHQTFRKWQILPHNQLSFPLSNTVRILIIGLWWEMMVLLLLTEYMGVVGRSDVNRGSRVWVGGGREEKWDQFMYYSGRTAILVEVCNEIIIMVHSCNLWNDFFLEEEISLFLTNLKIYWHCFNSCLSVCRNTG